MEELNRKRKFRAGEKPNKRNKEDPWKHTVIDTMACLNMVLLNTNDFVYKYVVPEHLRNTEPLPKDVLQELAAKLYTTPLGKNLENGIKCFLLQQVRAEGRTFLTFFREQSDIVLMIKEALNKSIRVSVDPVLRNDLEPLLEMDFDVLFTTGFSYVKTNWIDCVQEWSNKHFH